MIDRKNGPVRASYSLACLELLYGAREGEPRYTLLVSLPGRDGTVARSWGSYGKWMDEAEIADFISYTQKTLTTVIALKSGWQQELGL
jgi:hypothetical protein